jgi:hypothetical protein
VPDLALPEDFESVVDDAWHRACDVPGYIGEMEFRALCLIAAGAPGPGLIVEIGSFKGKSTIGLASLAARYGLRKPGCLRQERPRRHFIACLHFPRCPVRQNRQR